MRKDGAATASKQEDVSEASLVQDLFGVSEHLNSPALVGGYCDSVSILLDGCSCNLISPPVVSEVDDLAALTLQNPTKYPYGHIMAIKDGRSRDHTQGHASIRGTGAVPRNAVSSTTNHANSDPALPQECAARVLDGQLLCPGQGSRPHTPS